MNAIATIETPAPPARLNEADRFDLMQRQARLYASSPLIPAHLRQGGETVAMANCYIGLQMADAMGDNPLIVMQNIHVVNGKAGFDSKYMIGKANASGVFRDGIDWRVTGSGTTLSVTAFGTLAATGREVAFTADMAMAAAEGWTKNPKYKSMPELMLRYRSAAFLVRLYCPQVMLGFKTREEVEDMAFASPTTDAAVITVQPVTAQIMADFDDAPEADAVEVEIEADPTPSPAISPAVTGDHSAAGEAPQSDAAGETLADRAARLRSAMDQAASAAVLDRVMTKGALLMAELADGDAETHAELTRLHIALKADFEAKAGVEGEAF